MHSWHGNARNNNEITVVYQYFFFGFRYQHIKTVIAKNEYWMIPKRNIQIKNQFEIFD